MKTDTLLMIGAAAVGIYLLTRPRVPTQYGVNPYGTGMTAYNPYTAGSYGLPAYQQQSTVAQDITAGASGLSTLADAISNFF
jgi:hypothetical protein